MDRRLSTGFAAALLAVLLAVAAPAGAQTNTPTPGAAQGAPQASPKDAAPPTAAPASPTTTTPQSARPPTPVPTPAPAAGTAPPVVPAPATPTPPATSPATPSTAPKPNATPEGVPLAPSGKKQTNEIEPNATPTKPESATTENVEVPARPIVAVSGQSSYDEAFKSIKASLESVEKAMGKAGIKPIGHPITIFSAPDDKGFKYQAGVPVAQKPEKTDLGGGVLASLSPAGKAIKFQHRGAYDDIDSTYDVITAFLDAKGLQVDSPYIEEYLTELTTADDPNLQVDIYVFVK